MDFMLLAVLTDLQNQHVHFDREFGWIMKSVSADGVDFHVLCVRK